MKQPTTHNVQYVMSSGGCSIQHQGAELFSAQLGFGCTGGAFARVDA